MSIAMTPQQRADFDEQGFIILEDFLTPAEVDTCWRQLTRLQKGSA